MADDDLRRIYVDPNGDLAKEASAIARSLVASRATGVDAVFNTELEAAIIRALDPETGLFYITGVVSALVTIAASAVMSSGVVPEKGTPEERLSGYLQRLEDDGVTF